MRGRLAPRHAAQGRRLVRCEDGGHGAEDGVATVDAHSSALAECRRCGDGEAEAEAEVREVRLDGTEAVKGRVWKPGGYPGPRLGASMGGAAERVTRRADPRSIRQLRTTPCGYRQVSGSMMTMEETQCARP